MSAIDQQEQRAAYEAGLRRRADALKEKLEGARLVARGLYTFLTAETELELEAIRGALTPQKVTTAMLASAHDQVEALRAQKDQIDQAISKIKQNSELEAVGALMEVGSSGFIDKALQTAEAEERRIQAALEEQEKENHANQ